MTCNNWNTKMLELRGQLLMGSITKKQYEVEYEKMLKQVQTDAKRRMR